MEAHKLEIATREKAELNTRFFAKPQVSLTAPNRDQFAQVSLTVWIIFLDAIAKAKKPLCGKDIFSN